MTIPDGALIALGHSQPPPPGAPGMFALAAPGKLAEMLEATGFYEIDVEEVPITWQWGSVLDWIGETRDRSHNFATVWAGLSDDERQRLRARVAADARALQGRDRRARASRKRPGGARVGLNGGPPPAAPQGFEMAGRTPAAARR